MLYNAPPFAAPVGEHTGRLYIDIELFEIDRTKEFTGRLLFSETRLRPELGVYAHKCLFFLFAVLTLDRPAIETL